MDNTTLFDNASMAISDSKHHAANDRDVQTAIAEAQVCSLLAIASAMDNVAVAIGDLVAAVERDK